MSNTPRCIYCGKFIALEEFEDGTAGMNHTPDTEFTKEYTEYYHVRCMI